MTQRFANQSVIITEAGSGIGLATARAFAQEGGLSHGRRPQRARGLTFFYVAPDTAWQNAS